METCRYLYLEPDLDSDISGSVDMSGIGSNIGVTFRSDRLRLDLQYLFGGHRALSPIPVFTITNLLALHHGDGGRASLAVSHEHHVHLVTW